MKCEAYLVCPLLNDFSSIHDVDVVRAIQDVQSVRDKDTSTICQSATGDALVEQLAADVAVHGGEHIVQQDDVGVRVHSASEGDTSLQA